MSWQALADAAKYPANSAAEKLMLLAYADRHNEETGSAYPSIEWLCQFSSLNRKTVIAAIAKLEASGVLTDTGNRMGRTKQIKVYRLDIPTVPKTEPSQKRNSTDFSVKQSQKRDTEPSREPLPKKDKPSLDKPKRASAIPSDFWPVLTGISKATVDGWPPGRLAEEVAQFIDHHTAKATKSHDWQASFRTWVSNSKKWERQNGKPNHSPAGSLRGSRPDPALDMLRQAIAEERDAEHSSRYSEIGGRAWPSLPSFRPS